jgi:hypothetical protein
VFFNCFGNSSLFGEGIDSRIRQTTEIPTESSDSYDKEYDSKVMPDITSTLDSMEHKSEANKKPIKEKPFQADSRDKTSPNFIITKTTRKKFDLKFGIHSTSNYFDSELHFNRS